MFSPSRSEIFHIQLTCLITVQLRPKSSFVANKLVWRFEGTPQTRSIPGPSTKTKCQVVQSGAKNPSAKYFKTPHVQIFLFTSFDFWRSFYSPLQRIFYIFLNFQNFPGFFPKTSKKTSINIHTLFDFPPKNPGSLPFSAALLDSDRAEASSVLGGRPQQKGVPLRRKTLGLFVFLGGEWDFWGNGMFVFFWNGLGVGFFARIPFFFLNSGDLVLRAFGRVLHFCFVNRRFW